MRTNYLKIFILLIFSSILFWVLLSRFHIFPYAYLKQVKTNYEDAQKNAYFSDMSSCVTQKHDRVLDDASISDAPNYAFFVAGHTYGTPETLAVGLYPKFHENILDKLNTKKINFGFLTGDVVREASLKSWEIVNKQLRGLPFKTYIAPGNHDVGVGEDNAKRDIYKSLHGDTYYSFYQFNDLFIVLDPNINGWNIEGEQLRFLNTSLEENHGKQNNIFILMHQVIWSGHPKIQDFKTIISNSKQGKRDNSTNYWTKIAPVLEQQEHDVYILSGDVGAFDNGGELFCHKLNNIKYIASGMGGGARDNYLTFSVRQGMVSIDVVRLP